MLKEFVNEYVSINQRIKYINFGGCGVFAEHLYDKLELLGFKPKLVVFTNSCKELEKRLSLDEKKMIDYWKGMFYHIMIMVDGYYVDCKWCSSEIPALYTKHEISKKLDIGTLRYINQLPIWNSTFDRDNIPVIIKRLDKAYKKFTTKSLVVSK